MKREVLERERVEKGGKERDIDRYGERYIYIDRLERERECIFGG